MILRTSPSWVDFMSDALVAPRGTFLLKTDNGFPEDSLIFPCATPGGGWWKAISEILELPINQFYQHHIVSQANPHTQKMKNQKKKKRVKAIYYSNNEVIQTKGFREI